MLPVSVPIFVINLRGDDVRRDNMQRQLAPLCLSAEFIPAVDGKTLTTEDRQGYDRRKTLTIYGVEMMDTETQPLRVRLWRRYQRLSDGLRKRLFVLFHR